RTVSLRALSTVGRLFAGPPSTVPFFTLRGTGCLFETAERSHRRLEVLLGLTIGLPRERCLGFGDRRLRFIPRRRPVLRSGLRLRLGSRLRRLLTRFLGPLAQTPGQLLRDPSSVGRAPERSERVEHVARRWDRFSLRQDLQAQVIRPFGQRRLRLA